jgi:O-antigen/teichoic acid export membrane protein
VTIRALQYLAVRGALGALSLAGFMLFSRLVAPEAWGRYSLVTTAATALSSCLFGWMGVALVREHGEGRLAGLPRLFGYAAAGLVAAAVVVVAVLPPRLVWLGLALTLAMAAFELSLNLAQAGQHVGQFGAKSLVRGLAALCLGGAAAWSGAGEGGLLCAAIAAPLLALALFGCRDLPRIAAMTRRAGGNGRGGALWAFGWPIAVGVGLGWAVDMADRFLIAALLGEAAAGRYAMGYDIARYPLWLAITASSLVALPTAARAFDQGGAVAVRPVMAASLLNLLMVALPLLGLEMLLPHQLAALVLGPAYAGTAAEIMPLVALGVVLQGLRAYLLDITIHLSRRTRPLVLMLAWALAANLGLNLVLIPAQGLWGAALATVLAHVVALAYWAVFVRHWAMLAADLAQLARLAVAVAVFLVLAAGDWGPGGQAWFIARLVLAAIAYGGALAVLDVGGLGREVRRRVYGSQAKEVP